MRALAFATSVICIVLSSNIVAHAEEIKAASGRPTAVATFVFYNSDTCGSLQYPTINVSPKPQHGKVTTTKVRRKIDEKGSPCDGYPANTLGIVYQSEPGFRGKDSFGIEAQQADPAFRSGFISQTFEVTVR